MAEETRCPFVEVMVTSLPFESDILEIKKASKEKQKNGEIFFLQNQSIPVRLILRNFANRNFALVRRLAGTLLSMAFSLETKEI